MEMTPLSQKRSCLTGVEPGGARWSRLVWPRYEVYFWSSAPKKAVTRPWATCQPKRWVCIMCSGILALDATQGGTGVYSHTHCPSIAAPPADRTQMSSLSWATHSDSAQAVGSAPSGGINHQHVARDATQCSCCERSYLIPIGLHLTRYPATVPSALQTPS